MNTAPKISTIPHRENTSRGSLKHTTLKSVADNGSTIPSADTVPAGSAFIAVVYRIYGRKQVQIPSAAITGRVYATFWDIFSTMPFGSQTKNAINVENKKQYNVTVTGLFFLFIATLVKTLYAA